MPVQTIAISLSAVIAKQILKEWIPSDMGDSLANWAVDLLKGYANTTVEEQSRLKDAEKISEKP